MPTTSWPWIETTRNGVEGWEWQGNLFISKDYNPETGVAIFFIAPPGGRASIPAIAKGDPGIPFTPGTVTMTELDYDDPTPASAEWVLATPGTELVSAIYDFNIVTHAGAPGENAGFDFLDASDLVGTATATYFPAYTATGNAGGPGVIWTAQKVGGSYWPASIANTTSSDGALRTLATSASIPAQPFAWRPRVTGQTLITGTGADVTVNLYARLGNATTGDIVATAFGRSGVTPPPHVLSAGTPAGSATSYGLVAAGDGPTVVYLRAERQSGSDSFNTFGASTIFQVDVVPQP